VLKWLTDTDPSFDEWAGVVIGAIFLVAFTAVVLR